MLRIKLVKSTIGEMKRNRLTVAALGLRKTQQTVLQKDTPSVRGMIHKVKHLLLVEEVADEPVAEKPAKAPKAKKEAPVAEAAPAPEEKPKATRAKKSKTEAEPVAAGEKE